MDNHNKPNGQRITINKTTTDTHKNKTKIRQRGKNTRNAFSTATGRRINSITHAGKHLHFRNRPVIAMYHQDDEATTLT